MQLPAVTLELGIGAAHALVDVSSRLHGFTFARGRQDELSNVDTATGSIRVENSDRALEPENPASPYYPNVEPDAPVVLSATWSGTSYPLFAGVMGDLLVTRRSHTGAYLEIPIVDALERVNAGAYVGDRPEEYAGARIGAVLDAIGDTGPRALDQGQSYLAARTGLNGSGLSVIQATAAEELGVFFVAADGTRTFHDRHRRLKPPYTTPRYVFADDANLAAGEVPYVSAPPAMVKAEIVNSWTIRDSGGNTATAQDASSISFRGLRSKSRTADLANVNELGMQARFLLGVYRDPALRHRQLAAHGGPATFEALLALELGDRVQIRQNPAGGGAATVKDAHVERIAITHQRGIGWSGELRLSPASRGSYLPIGTARIGSSRIAY